MINSIKQYFSVQHIFNKVIKTKAYHKYCGERLMCFALWKARLTGDISWVQMIIGRLVIRKYLHPSGCNTLEGALYRSNLPCTTNDRLVIYQNWVNRPELLKYKD